MVTCQVCERQYRAITLSHLSGHKLTFDSYLERYPGADLGRKQRLLITREEAQQLYVEERKSLNAIAISKGVHPDLIRRDLIHLGFQTRGYADYRRVFQYDATGHEQLEVLAAGLWMGEGTKSGKRLVLTNTDPIILKIWLRFLLTVGHVEPEDLHLKINVFDRSVVSEAEQYWQAQLGMTIRCSFTFRTAQPMTERGLRQRMGTATLGVNSTFLLEIIQRRAVELATALM
jgi:hypothetical protein